MNDVGVSQVLKVYHDKEERHLAELDEAQVDDYRQDLYRCLRSELVRDLQEEEEQRVATWRAQTKGLHEGRMEANKKYIQMLDNALTTSFGWGLATYMPRVILGPLPPGAQRFVAPIRVPGFDEPQGRSCIQHQDGRRCFELPRLLRAGQEQWHVLHVSADQGSVGHAGLNWMNHGCHMVMAHGFDVWHRLVNDLQDAVKQAGMLVLRLEYRQVRRLRHGPWQGQGNHEILNPAASEYFTVCDSSNPISQMLYEQIALSCNELRNSPDFGSEEHMELVWHWCHRQALKRSCGSATQLKRWWAFEGESKVAIQQLYVDMQVLPWLGHKRGWWKSLVESHLLGGTSHASEEMGAPFPGEQAEQADPEPEANPAPGDAAASEPGDGPTAKRFSVNDSRKEAERRRRNIGNQLHFCARVLCRSFNNRLWIGMVLMTDPLHEFFADGVAKIKTLMGSQHLVGDIVQGSLQKVSGKLLSHFLGPDGSCHRHAHSCKPAEEPSRAGS